MVGVAAGLVWACTCRRISLQLSKNTAHSLQETAQHRGVSVCLGSRALEPAPAASVTKRGQSRESLASEPAAAP